jgi:hypothetical protein
VVTSWGQGIGPAWQRAVHLTATDCAVSLEFAEPFREGLLADAAHADQELAVAEWAGLQVMDDQRGPPATDQVCRAFGRVVFGAHPVRLGNVFVPSGGAWTASP